MLLLAGYLLFGVAEGRGSLMSETNCQKVSHGWRFLKCNEFGLIG